MAQHDGLRYNSDSDNRISDEQRNVLKDKTGFEGYTAYLEDYIKENSGYERLLEVWKDPWSSSKTSQPYGYECLILDLTKEEESSVSVDCCCQTGSNVELFTALSEPRKGVYGRIVICHLNKHYMNNKIFFEDLGLALNIGPTFVKSLYTKYFDFRLRYTDIPVFVAGHVMVGDRLATMTRCCISEKSSAVPIVFVADTTNPHYDPITLSEVDPGCIAPWSKSERRCATEDYQEMIMGVIERNSAFSDSASADALILPALLAAMHMDAYNLRALCDRTLPNGTRYGKGVSLEAMSTPCNKLHWRVGEFEDIMQDAQTGFSSLLGVDWSHEYGCEVTIEYFTQTINRARRLEAHIRDLRQVQIGQLSLAESRKSIELSNSQIEEGKRVKIFTILAFIYVPLNLASSIFGMNIQQLNNSGQSIKTFLVTAVVILVLTGVSWLCTEQVNQYRSWLRRPRAHPSVLYSPGPTYSIAVRVRMLVWLYCNGHWAWVRKTKAWWYILANSRADRHRGFGSRLLLTGFSMNHLDNSDGDLAAGDYVSKHMGSKDAPTAFALSYTL